MRVMDDKVSALAQDIKEGMDKSLGDINNRMSMQEEAIARVSHEVGDSAQETKTALLKAAATTNRQHKESARKQDEMGALLARIAQHVLGPTSPSVLPHGHPSIHAPIPSPLHFSASVGRTQKVSERGSPDLLSPTSGSHPLPPSHEYHVVEGEHDASGVAC